MLGRFFSRSGEAQAERGSVHAVPDGVRIYAVGDIHGRLDLLEKLQAQINEDCRARAVRCSIQVFLGDYIDRGPRSAQVIDWFASGMCDVDQRVFLLGNHEWMMMQCLRDAPTFDLWIRNGGLETMHSYGIRIRLPVVAEQYEDLRAELNDLVPGAHLDFLRNCRLWHSIGDYFFAHAGVDPGKPLDRQDEEDLLWIRDPFLSYRGRLPKTVVHGHTPSEEPEVQKHRIGVDTGAYVTGRLTCAVLESRQVHFLSAN